MIKKIVSLVVFRQLRLTANKGNKTENWNELQAPGNCPDLLVFHHF